MTYATVHAASAVDVAPATLLIFRDVSRAAWWRLPLAVWDAARLLLQVRPQITTTTGALPPLVVLALARASGIRTLRVDSIANSEIPSGSGHHAGKVATAVVTQWPHLMQSGADHWASAL